MEPADRVMLVDGRERRTEVASALSDAGFDVKTVTDVGALTDALSSAAVDCVVSTYQVPRQDGLEFLGGLHALGTVADRDPDIPRILYTDISNPDIAREAVSRGLFDYIPATTEASLDRLVTRVGEATAKRRAERRVTELSRVNEVIREVLTVLIRADSHQAVYDDITATLVGTEAYAGAWLGRLSAAGPDRVAVAGTMGGSELRKALAAAEERGVTVVPSVERTDQPDLRRLAVPVSGDGLTLILSTDRREAFAETERNVLAKLGEAVAYTLDAITTHETLAQREQALAEKTERLSTFASVVGHDLRNPLSVASGNLELAMDGETERLDQVATALDRMSEMIDDVLALARDGDESISVESVSLSAATAAAWEAVGTDHVAIDGPDDSVIRADPSQLRRLLENLFRNSIEHGSGAGQMASADTGDPAVTVRVTVTESGFAVTDDGPGLPETDAGSVFDLGVTQSSSGTGLGLAIVENIASAHGWSVVAGESDEGGARFAFSGVTVDSA